MPPPPHRAATLLFGVYPNTQYPPPPGAGYTYALNAAQLGAGALGAHLKLFEAWATAPLNLDRGTVQQQAVSTWSRNLLPWVGRFMGWAATQRSVEYVKSRGLWLVRACSRGTNKISFRA